MKNTKATIPDPARLQEMKAMRAAGKTLAEIGVKYGVSRERVRQIIGNTKGERMENKPATKGQLIALRDALLAWKDKDAAAAVDNVIDILSNVWTELNLYEDEALGTRCIISGGELLEI